MAATQDPRMFFFLSELLGRPVKDPAGRFVGRISDLTGNGEEPYPTVTAVLLKSAAGGGTFLLDWRHLRMSDGEIVASELQPEDLHVPSLRPGELFLKDTLLDKQVVDTDGAKIRRVNDLQLLKAQKGLYLVHVDVGFKGLLRRVGLERMTAFLLRGLFDYTMKDQLISWKFVQPVSSPDLLRLSVAQHRLAHLHPADLADIIEELDVHNRTTVFRSLDVETAAEILEETDPKIQVKLIEQLDKATASDIIEEMSLSEAADLLGDLPREHAEDILQEMEKDVAADVKELLAHPEEKAGGLMTTSVLTFAPDRTVREAMETIRREAEEMDLIYYLYVVDEHERLLGVLSLRDLIVAADGQTLGELMDDRVVAVPIEENKKRIAEDFAKYGMMAMPVVDAENRLRGVIRFKNLLEVIAPQLGR